LPDRDGALDRHPRSQPGHAGQEHRWQPDRETADPAGYADDPVAVIAQRLRIGAVALRVGGLAAEGIEDAQALDDIDQLFGQRALRSAVGRLRDEQPPQQRPDQQHERRHADQHENGQQPRHRPEQEPYDGIGDHRADPRPGDGERGGDRGHVPKPDGYDFAGRHTPGQLSSEPGHVVDGEAGGAPATAGTEAARA
jgi:hypothetical protein